MCKSRTDWKAIAEQLAQRVNFAITHLRAPGTGTVMNMRTGKSRHWRDYFADGLDAIPGVKVDRELMHCYGLPYARQRKAMERIKEERAARKSAKARKGRAA